MSIQETKIIPLRLPFPLFSILRTWTYSFLTPHDLERTYIFLRDFSAQPGIRQDIHYSLPACVSFNWPYFKARLRPQHLIIDSSLSKTLLQDSLHNGYIGCLAQITVMKYAVQFKHSLFRNYFVGLIYKIFDINFQTCFYKRD